MKKRRGKKGMGGMAGMQARRLGRESRSELPAAPVVRASDEHGELPDGEAEILEAPLEEGLLVDQGDGMRVVRRAPRRSLDDRETHELPDEPPKGWGDG